MHVFNALYTLAGGRTVQPLDKYSKVEVGIAPVPRDSCARVTRWLSRAVSYPVRCIHGAINLALLLVYGDRRKVISKNIYTGNKINYFPSIGLGNFHIVSSEIMHIFLAKHYRNDSEGLFQGEVISNVMLPLLKDIFQENVTNDDFLLTCSKNFTETFRTPISDLIGTSQVDSFAPQLDKIILSILAILEKKENNGVITIKAAELCEIFTASVISRLLGDKDSYENYVQFAHNIKYAIQFQLIRKFKLFGPTEAQTRKYETALASVRKRIEKIASSEHPFIHALRQKEISDSRIKGLILLLYIGGFDPPSYLLQYIFWRLGQHDNYQEQIMEEMRSMNVLKSCKKIRAFSLECLRMFPAGDLFVRQVNTKKEGLVITAKNSKGAVKWTYNIQKGDGILFSNYMAARDPKEFPSPHAFNPNRESHLAKFKPFSDGPHICPGMHLAMEEIVKFPAGILGFYHVKSSPCKPDLLVNGFANPEIAEEVTLTLTKRKNRIVFMQTSSEGNEEGKKAYREIE